MNLESHKSRIDALNLEARSLWHSDVAKAMKLAQDAEQLSTTGIFERQNYETGRMDSRVMQAQCGLKAGLYEQAITHMTKALDFYHRRSGEIGLWHLNAYFTIGTAYSNLGNLTQALEWLQKLIEHAERLDDRGFLALGLRNIGTLYGHQSDYTTAIYFYELAIPHFEHLKLSRGLASVYGNYCWLYRQMDSIDLAIEYGTRSLRLFEDIGDRDGQALTHILLGNLRLQQSKFEQASDHLQMGLQIALELGVASYIADGYLNLGRLYERQKKLDAALEVTLKGLAHAETMQQKNIQMNCHLHLFECYKQIEAWKTAFAHHEQYSALKDEIRTQESIAKLRNLEVAHKTQQAQREADAERRLRQEDLRYYEQLNQIKDEILNTASHDLKSPLVAMESTITSLKQYGRIDDEQGHQLMVDLDKTIRQMGGVIMAVLDLAKLETGRALVMERHNFVHAMDGVIRDMERMAQEKHITLVTRADMSEALVSVDAQRMSQALHNLLANAIKYTRDGGTVTLSYAISATELTVDISDTGMGIPAHALPHVFERFYRVFDQHHANMDGTGLGLALARAIIEQHNGAIQVESEVGKGSTFCFTLPLVLP